MSSVHPAANRQPVDSPAATRAAVNKTDGIGRCFQVITSGQPGLRRIRLSDSAFSQPRSSIGRGLGSNSSVQDVGDGSDGRARRSPGENRQPSPTLRLAQQAI